MTSATATLTRPTIVVPVEMDFGDEAFIPSAELEALGQSLIARYPDTLGHVADVQVAYLWKKSGGKKGGNGVFGKTLKRGGLVSAFTTADFIVWLAADHCAAADYSQRQLEHLLKHELTHIGYEDPADDDGDGERKFVLRGHDLEVFLSDVREMDTDSWDTMLHEAAEAFSQAGLL